MEGKVKSSILWLVIICLAVLLAAHYVNAMVWHMIFRHPLIVLGVVIVLVLLGWWKLRSPMKPMKTE